MKDTTETSGKSVEYHIKVGTCKDCKWWEEISEHWGKCGEIARQCSVYHDEIEDQFNSPFETKPDFGCIHWEKKSE